MIQALKKAFADVFRADLRGLLWGTIFLTILVFTLLFFGFAELMSYWHITDISWLSRLISIFGYLIFFIMALIMFPVTATFIAGFFIDSVVVRLAKKADKVRLREVPLKESLKMSGVVAIKGLIVSGIFMPIITVLGFIPLVNLVPTFLYYILNGRLFAGEYFFAVATRYMSYADSKKMFEKNKTYWRRAGILIAFLMTIPVINIISPLVSIAFMQRLFLMKREQEQTE